MNKIKFLSLLALAALSLTVGKVMAADPVFIGARDSAYVVTTSSVNISSAPTTYRNGGLGLRLPAVSGYRSIKIQLLPTSLQDGTTVFYNFGASTATIYSSGYMVRVSTLVYGVSPGAAPGVTLGREVTTNEIVIENNGQVNVMTGVGVAPIAARTIEQKLGN